MGTPLSKTVTSSTVGECLPVRPQRAKRVVFLTNIPSPYQVDLFTALSKSESVEPLVVFCNASEHDRQFSVSQHHQFNSITLSSRRMMGTPKDWHSNSELPAVLAGLMPLDAAVVSGSYFMPMARSARRFLQRNGVPWVYWGEDPSKKQTGRLKQWLKRCYLRWFLAPSRGVLGIGSRACANYHPLLTERQRLENLPYAPNLQRLLSPSPEVLGAAERLRSEWGVASPLVVLFAGSLTERKAPDLLLESFCQAAAAEQRLRMHFAGDGPLRAQLELQATRLGVADKVRFHGFVEGEELDAAYLSSDLLVLPTRTHEGWGVVVQEALAAGVPVIATDRVGAALDLIEQGQTGWLVPAGDADAIAASINQFVTTIGPDDRALWAERCREKARPHDCQVRADEFAKFLTSRGLGDTA